MKLRQAESAEEIEQARELFMEYAAQLDVDLCFQNFDEELRSLPGSYVPPDGRLLLAYDDDEQLIGCVALRRIGADMCEMKRLYLRTAVQGRGLGRRLAVAIIEEARGAGYARMRLDTLPRKMPQAVALYRSLGFKEIPPYNSSPIEELTFMEIMLR